MLSLKKRKEKKAAYPLFVSIPGQLARASIDDVSQGEFRGIILFDTIRRIL